MKINICFALGFILYNSQNAFAYFIYESFLMLKRLSLVSKSKKCQVKLDEIFYLTGITIHIAHHY